MLRVHFISMSADHHSRLKTISLAPYALKAYLDSQIKEGIETSVSDPYWYDNPDDIIAGIDADVVMFSIYAWNKVELIEISKMLKLRNPETIIVFGGPDVSPIAEETMQKIRQVDIIAYHVTDGELIVTDLVKALLGLKSLDDVAGIIYRQYGEIIKTQPVTEWLYLDETPSPYLTGDIKFEQDKDYIVTLDSSRGCPYDCGYCYWGKQKGKRDMPLESIIRQVEYLYKLPNVKMVHFTDADFLSNPYRALTIIRAIERTKAKIETYVEIHARNITAILVKHLARLHNFQFILSPQTANEKALDCISLKRDKSEVYKFKAEMIRGIAPDTNITVAIILGLPHETLDSFKATLNFCLSLEPTKLMVGPLILLPGSRFYQERDELGFVYTGGEQCAVIETATLPRSDMEKAVKLYCWIQLLINYYPAIRKYLYSLVKKDNVNPVERIEKWVEEIERLYPLLRNIDNIVGEVTKSFKNWNEVKREFFIKGTSQKWAYHIYNLIYYSDYISNHGLMENTIRLGIKIYNHSPFYKTFDQLPREMRKGFTEDEIRSIYPTFKIDKTKKRKYIKVVNDGD